MAAIKVILLLALGYFGGVLIDAGNRGTTAYRFAAPLLLVALNSVRRRK